MKKRKKQRKIDMSEISEFDFSKSWANPYSRRLREGTNIVKIEPTLMKFFPNAKAVNAALRSLVHEGKTKRKRIAA